MYKEASRLKLRIRTARGPLSVEQLWDLPLNELDALAVSLEKEYKNSAKKSFLEKKTPKNKLIKLQFDITLDILTTKVEARDAAREEYESKQHNAKIDSLIAEKQDEEMKTLSVKELERLRK